MSADKAARGESMAARRFVDTEETFHFFDDDVVLGTNEVRSGEEDGVLSSGGSSDDSESNRRRRDRRRRRARSTSSALSRGLARRRSRVLCAGAMEAVVEADGVEWEDDEDVLSDEEGDYEAMDAFATEDNENENEANDSSARDAGGNKTDAQGGGAVGVNLPWAGAARFEQIFDPFRDLYVSPVASADCEDAEDSAFIQAAHKRRQARQLRKARRALATFTRRLHCANGYRYRKQSEFMGVCYLRALDGDSGYQQSEAAAKQLSDGEGGSSESDANKKTKTPLLAVSRKEEAVETTVPTLLPREWPHLPYRSPLEWHDDVGAAVEFLSRLAELPEGSLVYEPIDTHKFAAEVATLLEHSEASQLLKEREKDDTLPPPLAQSAVAGLVALLAMGVQLQSFTLLSDAVLRFVRLGKTTFLGRASDDKNMVLLQRELQRLLGVYCKRLAKHAAESTVAATFPRDLAAQWKVCSYQPSTSDAIATDGLYLYIFGRSGLLKIGTGNGATVRDFVYARNKKYTRSREAERSWLCCIGDSLYCRTIIMPGHRVDRIRTDDLGSVQELFLAPNHALIGKGITESSVYAMVTDGIDLYTIRCIDTYKRPLHGKSSSSRKLRGRAHKSRKSTPVSEIVSAVLGKSSEGPLLSPQALDDAVIQVGDRVVRGPDWKWSNQDGEKGSPGTVERISTWGGVKGSGVTVRWDENQRVNTYRWGAEGCYDLYIILEKDGEILERKPLPASYRARKANEDADASRKGTAGRGEEAESMPRHQFVLYRHKVSELTSIMKLKERDIDLFLDLTPSRGQAKEGSRGAELDAGGNIEGGSAVMSALHSHTLSLSTSRSGWACDGGTSSCLGDNAPKRYRCISGCDYDLCQSCMVATMIDKKPSRQASAGEEGEEPTASPTAEGTATEGEGGDGITDEQASASKDITEVEVSSQLEGSAMESSAENGNPFAGFDAALFHDSESEASMKKKLGDDKKKRAQQTEDQLVDNLAAFWCGVYTCKECQVALRRNGLVLNKASSWLNRCGEYLREPMIIPTTNSVVLSAKVKSGALDPVLLIAGTFYATQGQLCVVSPPGLYTVGEGHSDRAKRAASSSDASWFFSLETGTLLAEKPVLLKGVPAGSPTCVDVTRKRLLVFSGYLNCLEEYTDRVQLSRPPDANSGFYSSTKTLAETGQMLAAHLARLMRGRATLPAYKHLRVGLQDILFQTGREPAVPVGGKQSSTSGASKSKDGAHGAKSKARRIKNVRGRLKELERLQLVDRPGHFIPFCVDFEDGGLLHILQAITHCWTECASGDENLTQGDGNAPAGSCRLVANLLGILSEMVQEFEFVGVTIHIGEDDQEVKRLFRETERVLVCVAHGSFDGELVERGSTDATFQRERSEMVVSAHFLLTWGIRKGIFCASSRSQFFVSTCERVINSGDEASTSSIGSAILPSSYFSVMLDPRESLLLQSKRDCDVGLLRSLLYSPMDTGRIAIADFVPTEEAEFLRFLEILFSLSKLECSTNSQRRWRTKTDDLPFQTPVSKALHSVMNYCNTRIYDLKGDSALPGATNGETVGSISAFEHFALVCFDFSLKALRLHSESECTAVASAKTTVGDDLRSSVVGTILPLVVATIPNVLDQLSDGFCARLFGLMEHLDAFIAVGDDSRETPATRPSIVDGAAFFEDCQEVETAHPYGHTQPAFRRVVRIPGARVLHFEFDPRCRTTGESDFVLITPGVAWLQTDRVPYGDIGIGEDGGCFFGSYSKGSWPAEGLTVVGDTATVMLCATSQGRSGTNRDEKKRWGLKCTVRGLFGSPKKPWIAELGSAVANACSIIGDKLLRGPSQHHVEKTCQPWAAERGLFDLTPSSCNVLRLKSWELLNEIAENTARGAAFFGTLDKYARLRKLSSQHTNTGWTESLTEAAAVFLARSDHQLLASWIAANSSGNALPASEEQELFQPIAAELGKLERWMLRHVQLVNEWHYLLEDEVSLDELMERYADNSDRLSELCQLKNVPFKESDMVGCIKAVHEVLTQEIAAELKPGRIMETDTQQSSSSHQAVAQSVSTKARFLRARWQKCSKHSEPSSKSATDSVQSWAQGQLSQVGNFLRATVTVSSLEECSAVHSSRLASRLSGVAFCKDAFAALKTKDMAAFFVGRVLHAIPASNAAQDDGVFSGCALADPHLLAKMSALLHSYTDVIGSVAARESERPVIRVAALAEFINFTHSIGSISNRLVGLEEAARLVVALDDERSSNSSRGVPFVTPGCEMETRRPMHMTGVVGQVYDAVWIMLRLLAEEILDGVTIAEVQSDPARKQLIEKVLYELRALYGHFTAKTGGRKCRSTFLSSLTSSAAYCEAPSLAVVSTDVAIWRLVCAVVGKIAMISAWPETFGWWVQKAVDLVVDPSVPLYLNVAGVRLLKSMLKLKGDAVFELDVDISSNAVSAEKNNRGSHRVAIGGGIQRLLLQRIGRIVSPLPSLPAGKGEVDTTPEVRCVGTDYCVVIFRSEHADSKLVEAASKVGEPDISSLEIPLEAAEDEDAVKKATVEAEAECAAAESTMNHPSVRCDSCNQSPLRGFRFKCFTCPNYDLCTGCYMGQKHNADHAFVRMSDSAGTGDLLLPRSKGGGIVPETTLVGSKQWKGNLLRVQLSAHGFVVYCSGDRHECGDTAKELAQMGFLVTVAEKQDVAELGALYDWETKVQLAFEPGSARLSQRRSTSTSQKGLPQKSDRDVISAFNQKAVVVNFKARKDSDRKVEDERAFASEAIAVLRLLVSRQPRMERWRSSSLKILTEILEKAPSQLGRGSVDEPGNSDDYFLTMGAAQVLGGFREPVRVGGTVSITNLTAGKLRGGRTRVVYSYAFGNDSLVIAGTSDAMEVATRAAANAYDDELFFSSCTASEVTALSEVPLDDDAVRALEPLAPAFCSVVEKIYAWTTGSSDTSLVADKDEASSGALLLRWELGCALMQAFSLMATAWPSLFDNQVISTSGNAPALLFQLAQMCVRDVKVKDIEDARALLWRMEWLRSRKLHYSLATRPISATSFGAGDEKTCVLRPPPVPLSTDEASPSQSSGSDAGGLTPSEYFYNLYAFSSRVDLPQHSGRNKLLEYWEKNVIPAIETYVSGSFKSYEMDYFFAQLREPLREGNSAAALKIAFTLCDGHVPSGCHYPDPDTDWSALQIDDIEVGGRYVVASEHVDVAGWPDDMMWTMGHSGAVRVVDPSGMVLLQVLNPMTSSAEYWWYHVDDLRSCASISSTSDQSVTDFESSRAKLQAMNQQLIYCLSRKSVFDLLQVAPENSMVLSIETRKTSLSRTSSSPFPLPASSSPKLVATTPAVLATAPVKDLGNRYNLADLLRLAAAADLGCPEKALGPEMGANGDTAMTTAADKGASLYLRPRTSLKASLITVLQAVLNQQFERAASSQPPPVMDRSASYDENASVTVTTPAKKYQKKRGKAGTLAEKLAAASSGGASLPPSSPSAASSSGSTTLRTNQPKLQHPEVVPVYSTKRYRYMLMEALLEEFKTSLDASSAFLRSKSFMVASDSPPQPLVLVHVPEATCLVLSFVVHPVLMDLPAGASLEFFRDERCTDRLFGYFGEKRGLNYLPPLVVPGDRCYVRVSQGTYARYKFHVAALTSDFGLALWICEEIYQKLLFVQLSNYEVETVLTTLLNALVEYLVATSACLASSARNAVFQIAAKLINFALGKGAVHAVPIAKLSGLVKELTFVYDNERTTQKGLYSLYTQQLAELISLVEEVSSLKGGSSSILGGSWWADFVRMAAFTRVLGQGRREIATPDAFKRIYCGRAPVREIEAAHQVLATRDLFCERVLFLQKLPQTTRVAELEVSVSRFLVHLALEECGEADDQNVSSAAVVTRLGIISSVLYLPVDEEGRAKGYAMVDIGRADVIASLLTRIPKETLEFGGGDNAAEEDSALLEKVEVIGRPQECSSGEPGDVGSGDGGDKVWSCGVCTLENPFSEVECAACGSPIPPELAELAREAQAQPAAADTGASSGTEATSASGWSCSACTFVNSWEDDNCEACTTERSADLIPPAPTSSAGNDGDAGGDDTQAEGQASNDTQSRSSYILSAVRFVDVLRVAEEADEAPEQVADFLHHRLFESKEAENAATELANPFLTVLQREVGQYSTSSESKAVVDAFAALVGVKTLRSWETLPSEQLLSKLTSPEALVELLQSPLGVLKWIRASGYDLQFELNHYASVDDTMEAQTKWTHSMDCQLIAACHELSSEIGVLTLAELCPSHLSAEKHTREYPLLAALETRDVRLRFAVLQSLNKLLLTALPLVNLRPWSDPSSLRSRIITIRQLIFPGVKIRFFAQTQDNTSVTHSVFADTNAKRPMVTIDRRKIAGKRGGSSSRSTSASSALALRDPKRSLFASAMKQLSAISPSLLRAKRPTGASDPFVSFIVIFAGENVVGESGPYRQLFNDISNELLTTDGANPLFVPTQNNVLKTGDFRERYLPRPSSTSKELLQMFEFVGLLMGCCLRTGVRLNLRLAPLVWKMLVKQSLVFADLESVDHSLCESLKFLEVLASSPEEDPGEVIYESFTTTLSDGTIVELKPGGHGTAVTKTNCKEYIRLVKATRLQECKPQVEAMLRGLAKIVPVQLLQLCVWSELQQWVGGSLEIDVGLLRRHTRYSSGMSPEQFPHLETFWKVLHGLSPENKRRFINFAWGQDTLPADDAEFDRTHTRLLIKTPPQDEGIDQDALLPKADTCFFNIELPAYSSEQVMRDKLLLAITLCTSLDGDDQTAGHMDIYYAGDELDDDAME